MIKKTKNLIDINKSILKFIEISEEEPLKNECKHFLEVVKNNIQPLTDGIEGQKVVEVLSAIIKLNKI